MSFTTSNIRLVCFVRGEAEEDIFLIVIDNNTTVENLGVKIRNVWQDLNQKNFDLYVRKFKQINRALVNTVNTTEKRQGELIKPSNKFTYYFSVEDIEELKKNSSYPQYDSEIGPIHIIIRKDEPISELKEAIKTKKPQSFTNKVPISNDHDQLRNLSLEDSDELLAINDIGDYWSTSPPKEHIHILVSLLESTATSSREQKLLDRITSLEEKLSKNEYVFDVIVSPKEMNSFRWTANIEHATLEGLKKYIRKEYEPPSFEKDRAYASTIRIKWNLQVYRHHRDILESFLKLVVPKKIVQKSNNRVKVPPQEHPINLLSIEATKSIYVYSYLLARANNFKRKFEIHPQKVISGPNGHEPLDFVIDLRQTAKTVSITETEEIEEDQILGRVFGLVTDGEKFYFMECLLDDQDRPCFKLSEPVIIVYNDDNIENMVVKVLSHIVWLLGEAQKPVKVLEESREIKRVRSGELPKVTDLERKTN
ncbi:2567_t:CDS:2 [Gigaspora margarita]|uniref:2567_t:CDS:1 n=1 Tax=Gigaspora margarita TaxID=4874 RepID=A0ABN7UKB4_GIGMA|nr:2567_t:CDS:2 [Gigaspora margarita]